MAVGEPLHGADLHVLHLDRQGQTGERWHAVHQHRAGAAFAQLAPMLGAGQLQLLAQHLEQCVVNRRQHLVLLAVYVQPQNLLHGVPPSLDVISSAASLQHCPSSSSRLSEIRALNPTTATAASGSPSWPRTSAAAARTPSRYSSSS